MRSSSPSNNLDRGTALRVLFRLGLVRRSWCRFGRFFVGHLLLLLGLLHAVGGLLVGPLAIAGFFQAHAQRRRLL